jgi:hypothetical protein
MTQDEALELFNRSGLAPFLKPEGKKWYIDRLIQEPAYRRKERKRIVYRERYQTDGGFWYRERERCWWKYHHDEKVRVKNRERARRYRERKKAEFERQLAEVRELIASLPGEVSRNRRIKTK